MSTRFQRITPFLWFDDQAEEAVNFYVSIFDNARITATTHYNKESAQASGQKEGSVMTIGFELDGQKFAAINGGPYFKINEAISFVVNCQWQTEVDHYWSHLSAGGDPNAQQCSWLKDRFGVSWQVVPTVMIELLTDPDPEKARKTMLAMLQMKKIDIEGLRRATA